MKIRTKAAGTLALLLVLMVSQVAIDYRHSTWADQELRQFEQSSLLEIVMANDLMVIAGDLDTILEQSADHQRVKASREELNEFSQVLAKAIHATTAVLAIAQENNTAEVAIKESDELALLTKLQSRFAGVDKNWLKLTDPATTPVDYPVLQHETLTDLRQHIIPLIKRYQENSISDVVAQNRLIQQRSQNAFRFLRATALLALLVATLASFWLVRSVVKPLNEVVGAVKEITDGNHHRRLEVKAKDEFGTLAGSFNRMLDALNAATRDRDELSRLASVKSAELDDLFNLSTDVMAIASADGHFVRINPAFSNLLGLPPEEILGRRVSELIHPEDIGVSAEEGLKLRKGEDIVNFENRYRCRDGSWKWLSWHVHPRVNLGLFYAVARDVTESKAQENALRQSQEALKELNEQLEQLVTNRTRKLRESEERFRMMVEGIKDYAIILLDGEGCVVSWNRGAERLNGYHAEEVIGQHFSKFYPVEDEGRSRADHGLAEANSKGRLEERGWRVNKDGRRFLAHVVITAIYNDDSSLRGFAEITRDVTEQTRAEDEFQQQQELLRSLMDNLGEGVVACDANGELKFFNKTAREWHGMDIMQVAPEKWSESFDLYRADGVTLMRIDEIPLARAAAGERVRNVEMVIGRKNSASRHILASGDPLEDAEGRKLGAVVVMHDITERRNAERHNLRTQRLESIGTLSGGIAHDLNNALAPILMGLELLKIRCPGSISMLDTMEASALRGASMVKQLLTFAKGVEGERIAIQPLHLITELESILERTFPKNIDIEVIAHGKILPVLGDATQIHQVLLNLCVNARDAMPEGGHLTIEVENHTVDKLFASSLPTLKAGKHVLIRVKDSGTGIPPEIIERIFEPFFSTKPLDRGTGLGLSTVIGIVRSHGGAVQVDSKPNAGTTFSIYLPAAASDTAVSNAPFQPALHFEGQGRSILVVEDEPAVREVIRAVLLSLGFEVVTAKDGEEATAYLTKAPANLALIITDLHMPKMDGIAFVKKAREIAPEVPVIVSSGRMEKSDADSLADLRVRTLLHKPFTQGDLVKALQHMFNHGSNQPFRSTVSL